MKETLKKLIQQALKELDIDVEEISLEHPGETTHGDYATSVCLQYAKQVSKTPLELAAQLKEYIEQNKPEDVEKVEVAGPGFINIFLSKSFFKKSLDTIISNPTFGQNDSLKGEKLMVEHTDPNPFKEFHVGHLMPNIIGRAVANIYRWNGAEVREVNYQGDIGMHVAKAVWGMAKGEVDPYVYGHKQFEENTEAKQEITEVNKKLYARSDDSLNKLYDQGRKESLEYFDSIYEKLGAKFDHYFFESEVSSLGKELVEQNVGEVFERSEGAVVFHAEKYDPSLHTRVFINSEGLPTYEAKELGLAQAKFQFYPYTKSIVITGNEIREYFKVLLAAMKFVLPELREKTKHLPHGMLRLPTGKMSSRTGDVVPALTLIDSVKETIEKQGNTPTDDIAVGAIQYTILRQSIGGDIIFDMEKSVSTEGDSGVYLQYAHARACSLLDKLGKKGDTNGARENIHEIEKLLYIFPEVVERALKEYSPSHITTYLTRLAGSFNNFYAHEQVMESAGRRIPEAPYRLAIVEAFRTVMKNGLTILGIPAPERI